MFVTVVSSVIGDGRGVGVPGVVGVPPEGGVPVVVTAPPEGGVPVVVTAPADVTPAPTARQTDPAAASRVSLARIIARPPTKIGTPGAKATVRPASQERGDRHRLQEGVEINGVRRRKSPNTRMAARHPKAWAGPPSRPTRISSLRGARPGARPTAPRSGRSATPTAPRPRSGRTCRRSRTPGS